MNIRDTFQKEVEELKTFRDELKVQAHLGAAEAKETWMKLEAKWPELERRMQSFEDDSADTMQRMADATKDLMGEIRTGYKKLMKEGKQDEH